MQKSKWCGSFLRLTALRVIFSKNDGGGGGGGCVPNIRFLSFFVWSAYTERLTHIVMDQSNFLNGMHTPSW